MELLLHQELVQLTASGQDPRSNISHALGNILRGYGNGYLQLEPTIRLFLRSGVELSNPLCNNESKSSDIDEHRCSCSYSWCYTMLDALFCDTRTPAEAQTASYAWLHILQSEGYDVVGYLAEKIELHDVCQQFTSCETWTGYRVPRRLSFNLDLPPSVSWDWWIDPESPTFPLRKTFKDMTMLSFWFEYVEPQEWRETWPFIGPGWCCDHEKIIGRYDFPSDQIQPWAYLDRIAHIRSSKRLAKRARKLARAQKSRKGLIMPGAWPTNEDA